MDRKTTRLTTRELFGPGRALPRSSATLELSRILPTLVTFLNHLSCKFEGQTGCNHEQLGVGIHMSLPGLHISTPEPETKSVAAHELKERTEWRFEVAFGTHVEIKVRSCSVVSHVRSILTFLRID